jgi:acetyl-CoA acetyltransferase
MHEYGTTEEHLASVAVKNHKYGACNPKAMFQKEITVEKALGSMMIASPLRLYDCCGNADGAACIIIGNEDKVKAMAEIPVWIDGMGNATAPFTVLRREVLTSIPSAVEASRQAYKQAGVGPGDVDVADVHDCFTVAEILAYEDLGFCGKGEGGKFIEDGQAYIGGSTPVNVDGGLKSKGHPVGATGASMAVEAVKQLRGQADEGRQVDGAQVALTHNVGGIGQYCFVNVYRRD